MRQKLLIFACLIFFLIVWQFYKNNIFNQRFVDEEENFAVGKYLLKGEKLYSDLLVNHQPYTYIFSATIQKITKPSDTFFLIKKLRTFVLCWSLIWSLILIYYFGFTGLFFTFTFELTKVFLFGNLFLPEAFLVYPLTYLVGSILIKKQNSPLIGFILGVSFFLLLPLWPLITMLGLIFIYRFYKDFKLKSFSFGVLISIIPVIYFASVSGFLKTLFLNLTYTIPSYYQTYFGQSIFLLINKSFFSPLFALLNQTNSSTGLILQLVAVLFFANLLLLLIQKQYKIAILLIIFLSLANLHFVYPGHENYAAGFLPWYGLFIFLTTFISMKGQIKISNIICLIIITLVSFRLSFTNIFQKNDPVKQYSINFSTYANRGEEIKKLRTQKDTLFVSPDDWLVYWASDTNHLPKLFGYYAWLSGIPEVHQKILNTFSTNPPTFFYCENCQNLDLGKYLFKYKKLNGKSNLFILSGEN